MLFILSEIASFWDADLAQKKKKIINMLACHLVVKTNRESGFANGTKFQGKNQISQTSRCKIQKIPNFSDVLCNLPTKILLEITKLPKFKTSKIPLNAQNSTKNSIVAKIPT